MDSIVTKNYSTDEGNTWVIGGKLLIEDGAEVEGLEGAGSGNKAGVAENQSASTATAVAALKNDFNDLLIRLKNAGIMIPDTWNITAGLAPTPTGDSLVSNKEKVQSAVLEDDQVTVTVDVEELEESEITDTTQRTHKWLALEIGTGFSDITAVQRNGEALTTQDATDATAAGCASGSFLLLIKAEEVAQEPMTVTLFADGYGEKTITVQVVAPTEN